MSLLLHISDTHFGTDEAPLREALRALVQRERPALVVLTGDVTQRARATEFDAARTYLLSLQTPWLAVPGNHDLPLLDLAQRVWSPYARWQAAFGRERQARVVLPGLWVAGVDSTRPWRHRHGQVSLAQAEAAADWLAQAPAGTLCVVAVHHPLDAPGAERRHHLRGGREAARRWAEAGVRLVLSGHIHLPYVWPLHERWPELPAPLWLAQGSTALSWRRRPGVPNAVNLVRPWPGAGGSADGWQVERWDAVDGQFVCAAVQRLGGPALC
jgi:3',5'-cyclic AMP phosphodiesterase CpdA